MEQNVYSPTSREILQTLLDNGDMYVTEITNEIRKSAVITSRTLNRLDEGGLLESRSEGSYKYYCLTDAGEEFARGLKQLESVLEELDNDDTD